MKTQNIFVTGAGGFIGSHLVEHLLSLGYNVCALVRYNQENTQGYLKEAAQKYPSQLDIILGDVQDAHLMQKLLSKVDILFHLAALISIPYSYKSPQSYVNTNIQGTFNILQAALHSQVQKVLVTSTSEVYGTAQFVPISEEHPLNAQSPYAASKIAADQLALSFHKSFALPVVIARPFNTYGPRQSYRAVIPTIISQILAGKRQIQLGALHPTRDFNYVGDTVKGLMALAFSENTEGKVVNIGSQFEISIEETAKLIAKIMQKNVTFTQDPARLRPQSSEVERLFCNHSLIQNLCPWEPKFSGIEGFERGLKKTIAYFQNLNAPKNHAYCI